MPLGQPFLVFRPIVVGVVLVGIGRVERTLLGAAPFAPTVRHCRSARVLLRPCLEMLSGGVIVSGLIELVESVVGVEIVGVVAVVVVVDAAILVVKVLVAIVAVVVFVAVVLVVTVAVAAAVAVAVAAVATMAAVARL